MMPNMRHVLPLSILLLLTSCTTPNTKTTSPTECPDPNTQLEVTSDQDTTEAAQKNTLKNYTNTIDKPLSFTSKGLTFNATLTLPATSSKSPSKFPGVLILQDWGKPSQLGTTRGSLGYQLPVEVQVYQSLAQELAQLGFAVLRYDKRNCIQDTQNTCTYPREALEPHLNTLANTLTEDANNALETLRQQPEVSTARIAIIGHGQGAEIAAALTTSSSHPPAALVLLAPSMFPIHKIASYQTDYSLDTSEQQLARQSAGSTADLIQQQINMLKNEQVEHKSLALALSEEKPVLKSAFGLPLNTWKGFAVLHANAMTALSRKDLPQTLALLGALDADLPDSNERILTDVVHKNPRARMEILSDTTHDMIIIQDDPEDDSPTPPSLHPDLAGLISTFLYSALTAP